MGTSLWLVPSPTSSSTTALQDVIESLAKAHSSPSFPPHVTLASLPACITPSEIVACLSSEICLMLVFESIRTGRTFFQSVFIVIQASPQLFRLHDHVHRTLGVQPKTPEFPHLSLYYGDENKEQIQHKLQDDGIVQDTGPNSITVADVHGFTVAEIWVVECVGRPEEWSITDKIQLAINPQD